MSTAQELTEQAVKSPPPWPLRAFDTAIVILLLPLLLPLMLVVAVAVFVDSPGPVLYRSRRIGRDRRPFSMLKFRTMEHGSEGPPVSAHDDHRYTPFGRTLAYSRLDELPQLWNVLRGEMRLVGPRPELEDFVGDFPEQYDRILRVAPGLTGPAQLEYAWEGDILAQALAVDRARVYRESILPLKVTIDMRYAERHTIGGDVVLIARTLLLPGVRLWRRANALIAGGEPLRAGMVAAVLAVAAGIVAMVALVVTEGAAPI